MDKQRNPDHCYECGVYIGKSDIRYCGPCDQVLREEKLCTKCGRPWGGMEIQSTWHDIGNGVWEERIHLRLEDQRGKSRCVLVITLLEDTEE